jgi:hypothetical protein
MPTPIAPELAVESGSLARSNEKSATDSDGATVVTQPWLWPIRDTDEGRCRVIFHGTREQLPVLCVRGKKLEVVSQSLYAFSVHSSFRQRVLEIVEWKWFNWFILSLILLNSIALAIYQYRDQEHVINKIVDDIADPIFTAPLWGPKHQ